MNKGIHGASGYSTIVLLEMANSILNLLSDHLILAATVIFWLVLSSCGIGIMLIHFTKSHDSNLSNRKNILCFKDALKNGILDGIVNYFYILNLNSKHMVLSVLSYGFHIFNFNTSTQSQATRTSCHKLARSQAATATVKAGGATASLSHFGLVTSLAEAPVDQSIRLIDWLIDIYDISTTQKILNITLE